MRGFTVTETGPFTMVEALGRHGYFDQGIPPSGAMDPFALQVGNLILKNPLDEAGVEMTILGMEILFQSDEVFAVTGGECNVTVNQKEVPMWKAVKIEAGDVLKVGMVKKGCRSYLCIAGGIDVPVVLGSKSTYTRGRLGGHRGRTLQAGDTLNVGVPRDSLDKIEGRAFDPQYVPVYDQSLTELRVMWGPQDDMLALEGRDDFVSKTWEMTPDSDRVGCRFTGVTLKFKEREKSPDQGPDYWNLVDDGIPVGGIQVPGGTVAICMAADVVNAGGFVKPACLIAADQSRLAQLKPGSKVRFRPVDDDEAIDILRKQLELFNESNVIF